MKKSFLFFGLITLFILNACGPAAENREAMHIRAKSFQDSIALIIRTSMDEAAAPGPNQQVNPQPAPPTNTPANTSR